MPLLRSERYVIDLLQRRFGVHLTKIQERNETAPDFTLLRNEQRVFVAELKDIERYPASADCGWTIPKPGDMHYPFAHRTDNAVSRVADKIHQAYRQLKDFPPPRVLILLNHDSLVDVKDLEEAFTGEQVYTNAVFSYANTVSKKISEGKIKKEKGKIDLYIWIDKRTEHIWFRYPTQTGHDLAHSLFPESNSNRGSVA